MTFSRMGRGRFSLSWAVGESARLLLYKVGFVFKGFHCFHFAGLSAAESDAVPRYF